MRLSDAIETGEANTADLKELSLHRYGFIGSLDDANAVVVWLRDHPLVDVEWMPPDALPVRDTPTRQEQEHFRRELMKAYGGRCAVTDCAVEEVLDAAHLRPWQGNNTVCDGILLRTDIHRLMERGLLEIGRRDFVVRCAVEDYDGYDGVRIRLPKDAAQWPRI